TGLRLIAHHFNADNCAHLLERATHKSKREIQELIAELAPKPAVPDSIRKLPSSAAAFRAPPPPPLDQPTPPTPAVAEPARPALPLDSPRAHVVEPLAPATYRVQFTANRDLLDKLNEVKDLVSHSVPDGDLATIFDMALELLRTKVKKERFGVGCK